MFLVVDDGCTETLGRVDAKTSVTPSRSRASTRTSAPGPNRETKVSGSEEMVVGVGVVTAEEEAGRGRGGLGSSRFKMADLAYTIAGNVLDKLGSLAYEEVSLAWGMKDDLNKLKLITLALQEVLPDAETKQEERPTLKTWVVELKDTFHDAVDVLDEFECELLRRKVVKQYASFCRKVHRFFSHSNPIVYCFSVAHRVREIRERLDEIDKNMEKFQLIKIAPNVDQSNKEELEEIGESCCVELCNRSFFQADHGEDYFGLNQEFRVHDLIHNLACSITQNECSIVNSNDDRMISDTVRYLRIVINEINLTKLSKLKKLKSIHVNSDKDEKDEVVHCDNLKVLSNDSINCTTLRTLAIETTDLPQWLEQAAKTLRNLRIEDCSKLTRLPEWLPKLISLEKLEIICCRNLLSLPDGMEGLTSLTHLVIEDCNALKERCKREVGPDWHKIAHVPNLSIGLRSSNRDVIACLSKPMFESFTVIEAECNAIVVVVDCIVSSGFEI
ncbi:hypothetical protein F8388_010967 [Cannabis sativa]|uniref:Rx N-terminal domain-containing protein n=1 Tax=Cannabis sativa TaxID=3483 RepID=A0A7J6EE65_CANSA|nr:hypothetical protein F8388_010967 [Cannabis sativa]KAF4396187.1 hypothetical protein G4B88_020824 [Cannabis sativa]